MPTPTKGPRLGGSPAHERLMLANLATALFEHGRITTTEAQAKRLRPLAERMITFAKRGDLHARRQVMTVIRDKSVVHVLFAEIGPRYRDPSRRLHAHHQDRAAQGRQRPDGRDRARREPLSAKQAVVKEAEAATKRAAKKAESAKAAEATKKAEDAEAQERRHRRSRRTPRRRRRRTRGSRTSTVPRRRAASRTTRPTVATVPVRPLRTRTAPRRPGSRSRATPTR